MWEVRCLIGCLVSWLASKASVRGWLLFLLSGLWLHVCMYVCLIQGSNYFEEVGAYYKDCEIHLWFIGQEVKEVEKGRIVPVRKPNRDNMHVHMRRGTVKDFILKNVELKRFEAWRENSVVFGFNCGFGNFLETGRMECKYN